LPNIDEALKSSKVKSKNGNDILFCVVFWVLMTFVTFIPYSMGTNAFVIFIIAIL